MYRRFSLILVILFFCSHAFADIYYWIDKDGVKHFSNVSTPESNIKVIKEKEQLTSFFPKEINETGNFEVLKVYDGDSIKVKGYNLIFMVRLVGIDTPETGKSSYSGQPFSSEAKEFLEKNIAGQKVVLKSYGMGRYNRQLAEVFINNININLEILKAGLAEVYKGKPAKDININHYYDAQSYAKKRQIGIWSLNSKEYKSPKQWRKEHPR
ncbi:MAG: thermonuclease family protein [Desulfobacterales bacterium]|nr:thermonuclease family protein [Desulfobacterales bacterium]